MGIQDKLVKAKEEKKALKKEVAELRKKVNKLQRKIAKKEGKIDSNRVKIKKIKKALKERERQEKKNYKKKKKERVKKERTLVPETKKDLRTVEKTEKHLVPTPHKSVRAVEESEKQPAMYKDPEQDLSRIEGIGKKVEEVLNKRGITNYGQLANCSSEALKTILDEEMPNAQLFDTLSWPEQALLAANEQWEELKLLQDRLTGGRH